MDSKKTSNSGASTITKPNAMGKSDKGHVNVGAEHGSVNSFVKKFDSAAKAANPQGGEQGGPGK